MGNEGSFGSAKKWDVFCITYLLFGTILHYTLYSISSFTHFVPPSNPFDFCFYSYDIINLSSIIRTNSSTVTWFLGTQNSQLGWLSTLLLRSLSRSSVKLLDSLWHCPHRLLVVSPIPPTSGFIESTQHQNPLTDTFRPLRPFLRRDFSDWLPGLKCRPKIVRLILPTPPFGSTFSSDNRGSQNYWWATLIHFTPDYN